MPDISTGRPTPHPAPPAAIAWLHDEAGLRPPAIARLLGLTPAAWTPTPEDVPLQLAVAAVDARARAAVPDARARRIWWGDARREVGWVSPAELLRRGKVGEVLLLFSTPGDETGPAHP